MTASPHLIGIVAGLVSAVLFTSLGIGNVFAVLPSYIIHYIPLPILLVGSVISIVHILFAPLPILLAGFGWGPVSAALALLFGTVFVPLLRPFDYNLAILFAMAVGLPGLALSWLASLRYPVSLDAAHGSGDGTLVDWYPAGRIIMWAAVMTGTMVVVAIWAAGDAERYQRGVKNFFNPDSLPMLKALAGASKDPARLDRVVELFGRYVLPTSLAFSWLLSMLSNIWLAAKSAEISGQLTRPWPDLSKLEFPPLFPVAFLVSLGLGVMLPGQLGVMAMAFVGAFSLAYAVMGLTVVHSAVPGHAAQTGHHCGHLCGPVLRHSHFSARSHPSRRRRAGFSNPAPCAQTRNPPSIIRRG